MAAKKRKRVLPWLVCLGIVVLAFFTCPTEQAHKDKFVSVIKREIKESRSSHQKEGRHIFDVLNSAASSVESSLTSSILLQFFSVKEYGVISIGSISYDEEVAPVTIGIFGRVFVNPYFTKGMKEEYLD